MKLGEALARRTELQGHLDELRSRLRASALVQEGDSPPEDPKQLLDELESDAGELEALIASINRTNTATELRVGMTLTDALARRDVLALRQGALKSAAQAATEQESRYSRSEIRMVRTFDVAAARKRADELARERRELDAEIQAANWTVELIDEPR